MRAIQKICDIWNSQGCDQEVILLGVTPCGLVDPFTISRATPCLNRQRRRLSPFLRVDVLGAFAVQTRIATTDCPVERARSFFRSLEELGLYRTDFRGISYFGFLLTFVRGRDSSVGIATGYGLDGSGIESR
jgi:hypothetical protein